MTENKALTEYTDRELLKNFAKLVFEYDSVRDDELCFLEDHPNREYWTDEEDSRYEEIKKDVEYRYKELVMINEHIKSLK